MTLPFSVWTLQTSGFFSMLIRPSDSSFGGAVEDAPEQGRGQRRIVVLVVGSGARIELERLTGPERTQALDRPRLNAGRQLHLLREPLGFLLGRGSISAISHRIPRSLSSPLPSSSVT
jgi:hypothetical protein